MTPAIASPRLKTQSTTEDNNYRDVFDWWLLTRDQNAFSSCYEYQCSKLNIKRCNPSVSFYFDSILDLVINFICKI